MAKKIHLGGSPAEPKTTPNAKRRPDGASGLRREAPPALIITAVIVLVGALGAGAYYVINGGWLTQGQLAEKFKHETYPVLAARRGMTEPLEKENQRRRENGQPLLQVPPDRHQTAAERRRKLEEARRQVETQQGKQPSQNP